ELLARLPGEQRAELVDLLVFLGRAQVVANEPEAGHANLLRAVELARELGDAERQANAAIDLVQADYVLPAEYGSETIQLLRQVLAALPPEDSLLRTRTLGRLAMLLEHTGFLSRLSVDLPDPLITAQQAMAMARRLGDPAATFHAINAVQEVQSTFEDIEQNLQDATEMVRLAELAGDPEMTLVAHSTRMNVLFQLGKIDEADRELEAYTRIASDYRIAAKIVRAAFTSVLRAFMRGDLAETEAGLERARQICTQFHRKVDPTYYSLELFFLRREQDRWVEAEAALLALDEYPESFIFPDSIRALATAESGDFDRAAASVSRLLDAAVNAKPRLVMWLAATSLLAEICVILNDTDGAARLLPVLQPYGHLFPAPGGTGIFLDPVAHSLGILAQALGQPDDAATYFDAALRLEEAAGTPILLVHTQCAYARLLGSELNRVDDARSLLTAAAETAEKLRLPRAIRIVQSTLTTLEACHSP
ncbi:MAG TPA: hypothetical protein VKU87_04275, partial [Thermomicrobiaceae bacterium]|nr:hypothetical protein [Thermomicrobiaceae bacterium]